jgi:hypothetical protein
MKTPKSLAMKIRLLPVLMVGITLAVATGDAFAENGARPGTGNTEAKIQSGGGGTALLLVEKPAPGRPIGKPLPPIPIDPGKGDGRIGHDGSSDHRHNGRHEGRHRYYKRWHKHSRYESPPIIGKHPGRTSRQSDLFQRGVVGPQPGG